MFLFPQKGYLEQPSAPTRLIQAEECGGGQPDAKVMFKSEVGAGLMGAWTTQDPFSKGSWGVCVPCYWTTLGQQH